MVSTEVAIFNPKVGNAVVGDSACLAPRVKPVHVTVTAPAARVAVPLRVIVMVLVVYATLLAAVEVEEMAQLVPAVTRLGDAGNVRMTVFGTTRGVEVTKEMVAVPPVPTLLLMVREAGFGFRLEKLTVTDPEGFPTFATGNIESAEALQMIVLSAGFTLARSSPFELSKV